MRRIAPPLFALVFVTFLPVTCQRLTVRDVVELTRAGLGEEVLLALIEVDRSIFPIDAATIKELKSSGVSERVILAMVRSGREVAPVEQPVPVRSRHPRRRSRRWSSSIITMHRKYGRCRSLSRSISRSPLALHTAAHTTAAQTESRISSDRWIAEHMPAQAPPKQAEPVSLGIWWKAAPRRVEASAGPFNKHKQ